MSTYVLYIYILYIYISERMYLRTYSHIYINIYIYIHIHICSDASAKCLHCVWHRNSFLSNTAAACIRVKSHKLLTRDQWGIFAYTFLQVLYMFRQSVPTVRITLVKSILKDLVYEWFSLGVICLLEKIPRSRPRYRVCRDKRHWYVGNWRGIQRHAWPLSPYG